jgi:hypothetical protein
MLTRNLVFLSITILLFPYTLSATEKQTAETGFKNLMNCIRKVPLDVEQYKGIGSQQILLLAVIKNINNESKPYENIDIDSLICISWLKIAVLQS